MRIMILANNSGGLYKFRKELIERLVQVHEVYLCIPDESYRAQLTALGAKVLPCGLLQRRATNPIKDFQLLSWYKSTLREYRPDMVFTYTIKPNVYGGAACASLGIPYLSNITGLGTALENGGILQKLTMMLYRWGLRKAQKVFFQNAENQNFMLKHHMIKGEHDLLPGSGVNLTQYQVWDYPQGDTIDFIFVARVMKEKGIEQYLDAAAAIRGSNPETRFHVCGFCEQDYQQRLEQLHKEGTIIYHGSVKDMTPVYQMAACTVHPTYYPEGLSNVLLESAASGRPVITTDRSGCREVVDDGVNGFVVKQQDSQDLIDKIKKFLSLSWEQRRDMGLAGRAKVEREFDRNIVIEKYLVEVAVHEKANQ